MDGEFDMGAASREERSTPRGNPAPNFPSPDLEAWIANVEFRSASRRTLRLATAPHWSAGLDVPILWSERGRSKLRHVLRPRVATAIATDYRPAWDQLTSTDSAQVERLQSATLYDVCGWSFEEVAERLMLADREARQRVYDGRALLHAVGAWPWCCFDGGRPPDEWRTHGRSISAWEWLLRWEAFDQSAVNVALVA